MSKTKNSLPSVEQLSNLAVSLAQPGQNDWKHLVLEAMKVWDAAAQRLEELQWEITPLPNCFQMYIDAWNLGYQIPYFVDYPIKIDQFLLPFLRNETVEQRRASFKNFLRSEVLMKQVSSGKFETNIFKKIPHKEHVRGQDYFVVQNELTTDLEEKVAAQFRKLSKDGLVNFEEYVTLALKFDDWLDCRLAINRARRGAISDKLVHPRPERAKHGKLTLDKALS